MTYWNKTCTEIGIATLCYVSRIPAHTLHHTSHPSAYTITSLYLTLLSMHNHFTILYTFQQRTSLHFASFIAACMNTTLCLIPLTIHPHCTKSFTTQHKPSPRYSLHLWAYTNITLYFTPLSIDRHCIASHTCLCSIPLHYIYQQETMSTVIL